MKEMINKTFILENGKKYSIIESVSFNDKVYVYLVNVDDKTDAIFQELFIDGDTLTLNDIDSEIFKSSILDLFIKKFESD